MQVSGLQMGEAIAGERSNETDALFPISVLCSEKSKRQKDQAKAARRYTSKELRRRSDEAAIAVIRGPLENCRGESDHDVFVSSCGGKALSRGIAAAAIGLTKRPVHNQTNSERPRQGRNGRRLAHGCGATRSSRRGNSSQKRIVLDLTRRNRPRQVC